MRAYTFEEFIARPPRQVWATLTDLSIASRWRPQIVSMETMDGEPLHLGSTVKVVTEYLGRRENRVSTTTAFEHERRWTLHSGDMKQLEGWFDFQLEPEAGGTRVVATCDLVAHAFLPWLFLWIIGRGERARRVEILANLKRLIEG
jgi:uncharacterized protein YndB with AHSA1/START domain